MLRLSPVVEANTRRVLKRHRKPPRLNCTGTEWDPVDSELYNWVPQPEKYLLAVCLYGEQSNQQICMENYLLMAGLLNRTLVVSRHTFKREKRYDWDWEYFFDLDNAQRCFGNNTVISLREYKKRYPRPDDKAVIDETVCWKKKYCVELPETTKQDRPDIIWPKKATYEGFPGRSYIWTIMDVLPKFTGKLITFGDIYGEYLHGAPFAYNKPFGPIRRNCSLPFLPHSSITSAAEGFVKTFAGANFVALHLRRGDKYKYWRQCIYPLECFWPVSDVAYCLLKVCDKANASLVFVANNGHELEMQLLKKLLGRPRGRERRPVTLLTLPDSFSRAEGRKLQWAERWGWNAGNMSSDRFAVMSLEKLICSMSKVFLSAGESTFSTHIDRMRKAMGTWSCMDGILCAGYHRHNITMPEFEEIPEQDYAD
eukprot:SM000034S12737  [mRNA]  locus=s34:427321:429919:- [translate_table: standard]